ncbi:MAG: DUF1156 domain-containing protein [Nitrospirales bacterium]|nr:DUF1156 domain-containing protein [Nitrospirales bacterium]
MIEQRFDIPFIADLAQREKQVQQNYRPVIAVHKWFARRPGTLFRGLLLAEFASEPLRDVFYKPNDFTGISVADPFMGGGTPLLEANRLGCDITGFDINPMAYWIVKQEIEHLDLQTYYREAQALRTALSEEIGHRYRTHCVVCGSGAAQVKYFLWVKVKKCDQCGTDFDLFPGYLVAGNTRHPRNVFVCAECGELTEVEDRSKPGKCKKCRLNLKENGPAKRNRCACPCCGTINSFPDPRSGPPRHRLFSLEYHCSSCRGVQKGRFFKKPDEHDLENFVEAEIRWAGMRPEYVPEDEIPGGDETDRLHRWGYRYYREMFNARQLLGLEVSARFIVGIADERIRNALATNLSDLLRYQNMLCRYDAMALKSLDIFSIHGFPIGQVQCESNLLGIMDYEKKLCIGSGGWANIIEKFRKAKTFCDEPFEVRVKGGKKELVPVKGEWIGDRLNGNSIVPRRTVSLSCANALQCSIPDNSLDAVVTDPPYFANVQYAELIDFCYVWLRRIVGGASSPFKRLSTRNAEELTVNDTMGRGLAHFAGGLSSVFQRMAKALKPGAPFVFTYHHNDIKAYYPVALALLDARLVCSASLPCPAEMGASIHISGTGSSIIDTVFVCRTTGAVPKHWLAKSPAELAQLIRNDSEMLTKGNVKLSPGDIKCITYGHLVRLAIWALRGEWDKTKPVEYRIMKIEQWIRDFGGVAAVEDHLKNNKEMKTPALSHTVSECREDYGRDYDKISF